MISQFMQKSQADYLVLWNLQTLFPDERIFDGLIDHGVDLAHFGLKDGLGNYLKDLSVLGTSWDKLNSPPDIVSTSWRMNIDTCLIRRETLRAAGGFDPIFKSRVSAGLELGYRCLKLGALVEHRSEFKEWEWRDKSTSGTYCLRSILFCIAPLRGRLGKYLFFRRSLKTIRWSQEWHSWQSANKAYQYHSTPWSYDNPITRIDKSPDKRSLQNTSVSVIIPTLGRYEYIPGSLSLCLNDDRTCRSHCSRSKSDRSKASRSIPRLR